MSVVRLSPSGPILEIGNGDIVGGPPSTVKGVGFDGITGVLEDLNGLEIGAIIRFLNGGDSTSSGAIASYALASNVTMLTFNSVTNVLDGVAVPAAPVGQILIVQHIGSGTTTIPHESSAAGASTQRFRLGSYGANTQAIVLGGGTGNPVAMTAAFMYDGSRWVWINQAIGSRAIIPNALAPVANNIAPAFFFFNAFVAGGGGAADDVILTTNALPGFRILDVLLDVSTAVVGASCQLRNATGGGGGTVSSVLSAAATGTVRNNVTATNTIAAGGTLVLRRSDSGVAGSIIVHCVPI